MTEYEPAASSRHLLASPAYHVNHSASSGANSFPAALSYVNNIGGTHSLTFGTGANGQICTLGSYIYTDIPITFDLSGLGSAGFSIDGGSGIAGGVLTFDSSPGSGSFYFVDSYFATNGWNLGVTTTVNTNATLVLSYVKLTFIRIYTEQSKLAI